mmetsp:Transcript_2193/g.6088  ORF Transcript_2193/g.6088 Transcript_2193/m.6088 type:complete len:114 (-) Transcript_2193:896-1237(-)
MILIEGIGRPRFSIRGDTLDFIRRRLPSSCSWILPTAEARRMVPIPISFWFPPLLRMLLLPLLAAVYFCPVAQFIPTNSGMSTPQGVGNNSFHTICHFCSSTLYEQRCGAKFI